MKKKKLLVMVALAITMLTCFASGVLASSKLIKITAYLNQGISIILDGRNYVAKDANNNEIYPITYNNTTYLPLRAVGEATGLDVQWNQIEQKINLSKKPSTTPGQKRSFSQELITHQILYYKPSGITHNINDLLIGKTQYEEAVMISDINSVANSFSLTLPEGTTKAGITLGWKVTDGTVANYQILDENKEVLAIGKINPNSTVYNEVYLLDGQRTLSFEFKGWIDAIGTGYVIYDDSWIQ